MFVASALLYPCALALLCVGAGLLVDRLSGCFLPAPLLASVGVAALIGLSQLATFIPALAPATPYLIVAAAAAGLLLCRDRVAALARSALARPAAALVPVLAYLIALAPVLLAGRPTFSSFMALADSAVHMMGADYLIRHGQSYGHLDLHNSYGQFINDYYNTSYPSGADTLFGGSALLLRLPLIWAFQPFNAFVLATASGPALVIARRMRLSGVWAALAALCAVLPALVYGYELLGSIKEITAVSMLLTSGSLVVLHRSWMRAGPSGGIPLALVLAGGVSALGLAFGVWVLATATVLAVVLLVEVRARCLTAIAALRLVGLTLAAGLLAALPTWTHLSGSLHAASTIASTSNPGNLRAPLRAIQVAGVWLGGSYKQAPGGLSRQLTYVLIGLTLLAAVLGALHLLRIGAHALAGWIGLTLLAWLIVSLSVTTWASAKTLMITSPLVVLLAWGGVAALRELPRSALATTAAALLAAALLGGVLVSDAMQYRSSNLAPTARYQELAAIDARFAGEGPTLFTDFDEYSLYVLRNLDVGGPDFEYPPAAAAGAARGYGDPVELNRISPGALSGYPLIVTRRDPTGIRPPAAYSLAFQGAYYQVWRRRPGTPPALVHRVLAGAAASQCRQIGEVAALARAGSHGVPATWLAGAPAPELVRLELLGARRPRGWGREHGGLVMKHAGRLSVGFRLPTAGLWDIWVKGQIMPSVRLGLDGRALTSIGGQLSGNSLVTNSAPPIRVRLAAGAHSLSVSRGAATLAPGDGGSAFLAAVVLTPAAAQPASLHLAPVSSWPVLCGPRYQWIELLPR